MKKLENMRLKKETDELYQSIGEFVVKFEHICQAIRANIGFLLLQSGLCDQHVHGILLSGLNAEQLRALIESLVFQIGNLGNSEKKIFKETLKRFQNLIKDRNDIIHSTWFIGWGNDSSADFSTAAGFKWHKSQKGAVPKIFNKKKEDFDLLTNEAEEISKSFYRILTMQVTPLAIANSNKPRSDQP